MGSKEPARAKKNGMDGRRDVGVFIGGRAEGGTHRAIIELTRGTRETDVADSLAGKTDIVECVVEGAIAVRAEELE